MGTQETIMRIIEELAVAVPQLVATITVIIYYLRNIKKEAQSVPNKLDAQKKDIETKVGDISTKVSQTLIALTSSVNSKLEVFAANFDEKLGVFVVDVGSKLSHYEAAIRQMTEQNNLLVRQNKLHSDMIEILVGKDVDLVSSGKATEITNKIRAANKELSKSPRVLYKTGSDLVFAMHEVIMAVGKEEFKKLLEDAGYEKHEETAQP